MTQDHYIWTEKYRPQTLDTFVGNETIKEKLKRFIQEKDIPHLLLSGPAGTGKTTISKVISKAIEADTLYINASDENNIDTVRNKIKGFASSIGFSDLKVIILDEADYLTANAQAALRNVMETFSKTTRFILTCNYVERIIDPIVSRTQHFEVIPPSKVDVAKHVWDILQQENVTADKNDFKLIIDSHYPDIRKVLNECQLAVIDGQLTIDRKEIVGRDYKLKIVEILSDNKTSKKDKFQTIRQILADAKLRDFTDLYTLLYEKVDHYASGNVSSAILAISDGLYKDTSVPDKEINMMATLINVIQCTGAK